MCQYQIQKLDELDYHSQRCELMQAVYTDLTNVWDKYLNTADQLEEIINLFSIIHLMKKKLDTKLEKYKYDNGITDEFTGKLSFLLII